MSTRRRRSRFKSGEIDAEKQAPINLGLSSLAGGEAPTVERSAAAPVQSHPLGAVEPSTFLALRDRLLAHQSDLPPPPEPAAIKPIIIGVSGPVDPETPVPEQTAVVSEPSDAPVRATAEPEASAPEFSDEKFEPEDEPPVGSDRYDALYAERRYVDLLSEVARDLEGGEAIVPRLWWIRAQLAIGSLPLALLAARCATVAQTIERAAARPFAHELRNAGAVALLGAELVRKLREKKQVGLADELAAAISTMEAAAAARPTPLAPPRERSAPRPEIRVDPAPKAEQRTEYMGIAATLAAAAAAAKRSELPLSGPVPGAAPVPAPPASGGLRELLLSRRAALLGAALTAGIAYLILREPPLQPGGELFSHLDLPKFPAPKPDALALRSPRLEPVSQVNELASIAYDIDHSRAVSAGAGTAPRVSAPPRRVDPAPAVSGAAPKAADAPARGSKEVISIDRPTEPAEVRRYEDAPDQPEDTADFDFPPFRNSARSVDPNFAGGADRALTRFSEPRSYTIIAATRVMESASYWANSFGALDIGEEVKVEARIGVWLKIRMENGRTAYILAQDARE